MHRRLASLIMLYDKYEAKEFPKSFVMLGFGNLNISSKEELMYRIKELCDLLKVNIILKESDLE